MLPVSGVKFSRKEYSPLRYELVAGRLKLAMSRHVPSSGAKNQAV